MLNTMYIFIITSVNYYRQFNVINSVESFGQLCSSNSTRYINYLFHLVPISIKYSCNILLMVDKEILEAIAELDESELKRLKLLIDNKLNLDTNKTKISYRSKDIKCGRESCNSCPHGPYWYAEWSENGKRKTKYLGKILNEII